MEEESKSPVEKSEIPSEAGANENEEINWSQQTSSIILWIAAMFLLALIVFKGDNLWTVAHNFIFGIFGNMAILWNALLVYWGYMCAKQKGAMRILEITRYAALLLIFIDVLTYILIQSNGYRNPDNELTYSITKLIVQIYSDGSRLGGTGLIGGFIGEILMAMLGKVGAVIATSLILLTFALFLSHTTPVALIGAVKSKIIYFFHQLVDAIEDYRDDNMCDDDEETNDYDIIGEVPSEPSPAQQHESVEYATETVAPPAEANVDVEVEAITGRAEEKEATENSIEALAAKASTKAKKKKSKAEEIQEQQEAFAKQVTSEQSKSEGETAYQYPPVRLLIAPKNANGNDDRQELKETADMLIRTLEEYNVKASISDISRGPTVTRYEVKPAPGVKINKITNLSNDIALRLAAQSIRIEAPIPGKPAVGIEIPNQNKQMVRIREIIASPEFAEAKGALTVALGKDIEGNIVLCDLSKMPHLLIAGSTGSGKSVCVNTMLISLLYKYSPQEVRMVLIDPKSVEFDMYNGIPHLLVPVVCEPKKAAGALQWAVSEMLKRYSMLKEHGARNIDNYNRQAEETGEFEKLCRIVIVIDEMADLMIASPKEVEDAIARLAAMARAAGMYMVLATQRPSVDVITGTIKNNIPSRIALAVSSQIDSRTILDEGGAENLIGYGDMLYHPMGSSKHTRVQGCFVDDMEVERVISFVKQNGSAEYDDAIADEIERNALDGSAEAAADFSDKDEFFAKAVEVVTEAGQASTSMLQRRLGVGYARAGRIIDQLEEHGIIGPYEGSKPRTVLITHAQWLEMTMSKLPAGKNDPIVRSHSEFAAQTLDNGHEEITARQAEFFNAEDVDEDEVTDEDTMDSMVDDANDANNDADNTDDTDHTDWDIPSASQTTVTHHAEKIRDFSAFFDEDESEFPIGEAVSIEIPSAERVRDFTVLFEDEDEESDRTDFSGKGADMAAKPASQKETSDISNIIEEGAAEDDLPPWEEQSPPQEDSLQKEPLAETQPSAQTAVAPSENYDDILSAPWVRSLTDKK